MTGGRIVLDLIKSKHDGEDRLKPSTREQQTVFGAQSSVFFAHLQVRVIHDENFQTVFRRELITGTRAPQQGAITSQKYPPTPCFMHLCYNQKLTQDQNIHVIRPN